MTKTVTLGEICEVNPGRAPKIDDKTLVTFLAMADVSEDGRITNAQNRPYEEVKKGFTAFQEEDVLVAKITPCFENGKGAMATKLINGIGFGSTEFHVLRPKSGVLSDYIFYATRTPSFKENGKKSMTGSAGQQRITTAFVSNYKIPLPPLPEQRRIAALLDRADALRQKDRQLLAHYDKLAQSLFLNLFGDPVTNEKGWNFKSLEQLITDGPQNGLYKPSNAYGTGIPILRIDSFYNGSVSNIESLKRVRVEDKELRMFQVYENDIVINRVNSPSHLGKSALIPKLLEPTVFESNMMRLEINKSLVNPTYLIKILCHDFVKKQILERSKDAVNQSSINQQDVKSFVVPVPSLSLQTYFAELIEQIERQKSVVRQQMVASEALFGRLLQESFG